MPGLTLWRVAPLPRGFRCLEAASLLVDLADRVEGSGCAPVAEGSQDPERPLEIGQGLYVFAQGEVGLAPVVERRRDLGAVSEAADLRWRGVVLDRFDGLEWSNTRSELEWIVTDIRGRFHPSHGDGAAEADPSRMLRQEIRLEPGRSRALFAAAAPRVLSSEDLLFLAEDGAARLAPVETGIIGGLDVEVQGLGEDSPPVVAGPFQVLRELEDGAAVRPRKPRSQG